MDRRQFIKNCAFSVGTLSLPRCAQNIRRNSKAQGPKKRPKTAPPNIVFILADDMGIDSVHGLNRKSGIKTPHLDALISEGMTFTDAHSSSAVCSPTRYGVLTGRYAWRTPLKTGIVDKWKPPLIQEDRLTVGAMLQRRGYHTACIGKWHLGWNWLDGNGLPTENLEEIDFNQPVKGGPIERGFDYYLGDDVPNWPPFAWIEKDRLQSMPTDTMLEDDANGVRTGPATPDWQFERVLPTITQRCVEYIGERAEESRPFFLYFPMTSPHTPINPSPPFQGKSGISKYADFLMETDFAVGEVLGALKKHGLSDNTLVIFTADNGTSPKCNFEEMEQKGAHLRKHWRGHKADIWEGGHRVPFVAKWPGVIRPDSKCDEVVSLVDFMATAAEVAGFELPRGAGEDSVSLVSTFREGRRKESMREAIICHSASGYFAVRKGKWKAEFCAGSGGWSPPYEKEARDQQLPEVQLYDVYADPKEQHNLQAKRPGIVEELRALLKKYVEQGRSTPGTRQRNQGAAHWDQLPW